VIGSPIPEVVTKMTHDELVQFADEVGVLPGPESQRVTDPAVTNVDAELRLLKEIVGAVDHVFRVHGEDVGRIHCHRVNDILSLLQDYYRLYPDGIGHRPGDYRLTSPQSPDS